MKFLRKFGPWAIVGARFTPSVRAPIYLAVGLSQFGVLNFMKFDFLAALVHVPLLIWLGAYIGRHSSSMEEAYKIIGIIAVTLILGGILLAQAVKYFRKRRAAKK